MNTIVKLILTLLISYGSIELGRKVLFQLEIAAIKRIDKGLSSSEDFLNKLTGEALPF
ncbi:MAG: hypothetical protein R3B45_10745 [Bdellovibrionota bacterium]